MSKCVPAGIGAVSCPGDIGFVRRLDKSARDFCWSVVVNVVDAEWQVLGRQLPSGLEVQT